MGCTIIGCGKQLPALEVSNDDLAQFVDTSDEWIVERTGIRTRHIAIEETSTDLACAAASHALGFDGLGWRADERAIDPASIDLLICMTVTPDTILPSQAAVIKRRLGLTNAVAFDLNAACSGCVYGMAVAESMMTASQQAGNQTLARNPIKRALIIGVERLSRLVDWTDRSTCVLFGDGAGAALLEWNDSQAGIISSFMKNTDDEPDSLTCPAWHDTSSFPFIPDLDPYQFEYNEDKGAHNRGQLVYMHGQRVFKFATAAIVEAIEKAIERAETTMEEVDFIVPHQANERIIKYAAKKIDLPMERFQMTIDHTGNTSAASALIALSEAYEQGNIKQGDRVIIVGFGAGLTSGSILFEA